MKHEDRNRWPAASRPLVRLVVLAVLAGTAALPAACCEWSGDEPSAGIAGEAVVLGGCPLDLARFGFWSRMGRAASGLDLALPVLLEAVGGAREPDEAEVWTARGAALAGALFSGMVRAAAEIGGRWLPAVSGSGTEERRGFKESPASCGTPEGRA
jgi:hypothetical protein